MNSFLKKMDIVIQGGIWPGTLGTAEYYSELDFVNNIIISTWEGEQIDQKQVKSEKIQILKNKKPVNAGPSNVNLQIVSSLNGIKQCPDGIIMKIRSDQKIFHNSFDTIVNHFNRNRISATLRYLDTGEIQKSKIIIIGNNNNHPYHPQDHLYLGYKPDLLRLLSLPLSEEPEHPAAICPPDWFDTHIRPPMHIGMHYYGLFYSDTKRHIKQFRKYLLDKSPNRQEVMVFWHQIKDSIFTPLPRIDMYWEKYNSGYWYTYEKDGEYYAD